jgi:hypothetical protein
LLGEFMDKGVTSHFKGMNYSFKVFFDIPCQCVTVLTINQKINKN